MNHRGNLQREKAYIQNTKVKIAKDKNIMLPGNLSFDQLNASHCTFNV